MKLRGKSEIGTDRYTGIFISEALTMRNESVQKGRTAEKSITYPLYF